MIGRCLFFDDRKGWGFLRIVSPEIGHDVFVHRRELHANPKTLYPDDIVEFQLGERQGRPNALRVRIVERAFAAKPAAPSAAEGGSDGQQ